MEEKNNKYSEMRNSNAFEEMLKKEQINPELIEEVMEKIAETSEEVHNIIFVFTDNDVAVTGVHVPRSALNGEDGPVIFKNSKENSLTAAFSREYIEERILRADEVGERAGLGSVVADQVWISELEKIVEEVRIKIATAPLRSWDELLEEEE